MTRTQLNAKLLGELRRRLDAIHDRLASAFDRDLTEAEAARCKRGLRAELDRVVEAVTERVAET